MASVLLYTPKGNSARLFPHTGHLGLTPVRIEGLVRVAHDNESKRVPAQSLTLSVRCYQSRVGRLGVSHSSVVFESSQTLWSSAPDPTGDVGDAEHPFRITLPVSAGGLTTVTFPEYKTWWRIEAALTHAPIPGRGTRQTKSYDLYLIRYSVPSPLPRGLWAPISAITPSSSQTSLAPSADLPPSRRPIPSLTNLAHSHGSRSRASLPLLHYSLVLPSEAVGPNDLVSIPLYMQAVEKGTRLRSVTVTVERRIELFEPGSGSDGSPTSPPSASPEFFATHTPRGMPAPAPDPSPGPSRSFPIMSSPITLRDDQLAPSIYAPSTYVPSTYTPSLYASANSSQVPLISPPSGSGASPAPTPSHSNVVTTTLLTKEIDGVYFSRLPSASTSTSSSSSEVWSKTITLNWPTAKSNASWSIGETMHTDTARVRFFLRLKVSLGSASASSSALALSSFAAGSDSVELDLHETEREILVVSTNEAERALAIARYAEMRAAKKSKSQSPRRKHNRSEHEAEDGAGDESGRSARPQPSSSSHLPSPPRSPEPSPARDAHHNQHHPSKALRLATAQPSTSGIGPVFHPSLVSDIPPPSAITSKDDAHASGRSGAKPRGATASKSKPLKAPKMKRPHTSAGPADRANSGRVMFPGMSSHSIGFVSAPVRDQAREGAPGIARTRTFAPVASGAVVADVGGGAGGAGQGQTETRVEDAEVRAWEEELAKIEVKSRRSSANMLGFVRRSTVGSGLSVR